MHNRLHLVTLATILALAGTTAGALAASGGGRAAAAARPRLSVVTSNPFTVHGRHFKADRRVRVTVLIPERFTHIVRTDRHGSFSVNFHMAADRCSVWNVTAQQGRTSVVLRGPKPECPPMGAP